MEIRPFTDADIEPMAAVKTACWRHAFQGIVPAHRLDALPPEDVCARLRRELAGRPDVLVLDDGGTVAGYVMFGPSRDSDQGPEATGEVLQLYVSPAIARRGWGRRLTLEALDRLRSTGHVTATVWVFEQNEPARRLYESLGFAPDGATKTESIGGAAIGVVRYRMRLDSSGGPRPPYGGSRPRTEWAGRDLPQV
jgi:ribosomal protein S18 acetylase RimI-like enzyme